MPSWSAALALGLAVVMGVGAATVVASPDRHNASKRHASFDDGLGTHHVAWPHYTVPGKQRSVGPGAAFNMSELIVNTSLWNTDELAFSNRERTKFKAYRKYIADQRKQQLHSSRNSSELIPSLDGPFEPDQSELNAQELQSRLMSDNATFGLTYQPVQFAGCPDDCSGHGSCANSKCICNEGYTYYNCAMRICVHGKWGLRKVTGLPCPTCEHNNLRSGTCLCDKGWQGEFCDLRECPVGMDDTAGEVGVQCSGYGKCANGTCMCNPGHEGDACERPTCSQHGDWNAKDKVCECYYGYRGDGCEAQKCPADCAGNGMCQLNGKCKCFKGFEGLTCCPLGCHKHGQCIQGQCRCKQGWSGPACLSRLLQSCAPTCFRHGRCEDGTCVCKLGYYGSDCTMRRCPNNCNGRGKCDPMTGQCECSVDFTGEDCSVRRCPSDCQPDKTQPPTGKCVRGLCECFDGYMGLSCNERSCSKLNDCSSHGFCSNGVCACDYGFGGANCSIVTVGDCLNNCTGHGLCRFNTCDCDWGYTGADCSRLRCIGAPQSGLYNATTNKCDCNTGYSGKFCQTKDSEDD